MIYADHKLVKEADPDAIAGFNIGFSCIYAKCGWQGCVGEVANELIDQGNPDDYEAGYVFISAFGGNGYFGDDDLENDWVYAPLAPDHDEAKVAADWAALREEMQRDPEYILFDMDEDE